MQHTPNNISVASDPTSATGEETTIFTSRGKWRDGRDMPWSSMILVLGKSCLPEGAIGMKSPVVLVPMSFCQ